MLRFRSLQRSCSAMVKLSLPALLLILSAIAARAAESTAAPKPLWALPDAHAVTLGGPLGEACQRGIARLAEDPYLSVPFLRSDVSFEVDRWFTNYSGDISGRFIEIASLTSPKGKMQPEALKGLLATFTSYQKADGHYGRDYDWNKETIDPGDTKKPRIMPIFWGNARLLPGLIEAYKAFGDPKILESAKKMGDFYIATAGRFMDPARDAEYRAAGTYAHGYVTCYFAGMEGLVKLYWLTHEEKYLQQAERMADFMQAYDKLPLDHSHGSLSEHHALVLLYETTGKPKYLRRVVARWDEAVKNGYIWTLGGVGELFRPAYRRDEGCSEADWLRVCLDLWRVTGDTKYLDKAERLLLNHYAMNRTPNGGYGHHTFVIDGEGPLMMEPKFEEAMWCCTFHGQTAMDMLKSHLVAGSERGVFVNFAQDVQTTVKAAGHDWKVSVTAADSKPGAITCRVKIDPAGPAIAGTTPALFIRVPDWADAVQAEGAAREQGYLKLATALGKETSVTFTFAPRVEDRRFHRISLAEAARAIHDPNGPVRLRGVVLCNGPRVLLATTSHTCPTVIAMMDQAGKLKLGNLALPTVNDIGATDTEIFKASRAPERLKLTAWEGADHQSRNAFVFDLLAVQEGSGLGKAIIGKPGRKKK